MAQSADDRSHKNLSSKERAQQKKRKKRRGSGKLFLFLIYSVACGVGGVYVDRNFVPQARV